MNTSYSHDQSCFGESNEMKSSPEEVNSLGGDGAFSNVASEAYMKSKSLYICRSASIIVLGTIKRTDFEEMKVIGQFNLGYGDFCKNN
jgi:hypothetical protein